MVTTYNAMAQLASPPVHTEAQELSVWQRQSIFELYRDAQSSTKQDPAHQQVVNVDKNGYNSRKSPTMKVSNAALPTNRGP